QLANGHPVRIQAHRLGSSLGRYLGTSHHYPYRPECAKYDERQQWPPVHLDFRENVLILRLVSVIPIIRFGESWQWARRLRSLPAGAKNQHFSLECRWSDRVHLFVAKLGTRILRFDPPVFPLVGIPKATGIHTKYALGLRSLL